MSTFFKDTRAMVRYAVNVWQTFAYYKSTHPPFWLVSTNPGWAASIPFAETFYRYVDKHLPYDRPKSPGRPIRVRVRELGIGANGMARFGFTYAPGSEPDPTQNVVTRRLHWELDGVDSFVEMPVGTTPNEYPEVEADEGQNARVWATDVDQAGNESDPSPDHAFVVSDTIPPSPPGAPTLASSRQIS